MDVWTNRKRRFFRITNSPTTSSDNDPKIIPQRGCCFLQRKLILYFIRQANLNSRQCLLIISCQASSFISAGFFSSNAFDGIHPNLPPTEIADTIKLLNIELDCWHLHVDMALILIVATNWYALIPIVVSPNRYALIPTIGTTQRKDRREEEMRYSEVKKANTQWTWFHRSNISCVCPRKKGIKTLKEYNEKHSHLSLRRLQVLWWSPRTVNPYD